MPHGQTANILSPDLGLGRWLPKLFWITT